MDEMIGERQQMDEMVECELGKGEMNGWMLGWGQRMVENGPNECGRGRPCILMGKGGFSEGLLGICFL